MQEQFQSLVGNALNCAVSNKAGPNLPEMVDEEDSLASNMVGQLASNAGHVPSEIGRANCI